MDGRRSVVRCIVALAAIVMVAAGCSSAEDDLRADMRSAGFSDDAIECVFEAFDGAGIDLTDLSGAVPTNAAAEAAMAPCMEQVFGELFAELDEAFEDELGSTIEVDVTDSEPVDLAGLVAECEGGDNAACDELWVHSPFDSPEEAIAESCGGRSDEPRMGLCRVYLD